MISKQKLEKVKELLKRDYPTVETPLEHKDALQLLIAVALSAQTLDSTVNKKTPALFEKYKTAEDFAKAKIEDLEKFIGGINYYKTKSRNLVNLGKMIIEKFNGEVPGTMEELTELPGIGRKTANVIINEWFSKKNGTLPVGLVVDTHVLRVSKRLDLSDNGDNAVKVEQDLMKLFPQKEWEVWSLRIIFHGRFMCTARNPKCINDPEWSKICGCVDEMKELKNEKMKK
ncbi:MAG: endonuclease III [Candidatus Dojkabacteria bacterium]